jgi:hypothetical protein
MFGTAQNPQYAVGAATRPFAVHFFEAAHQELAEVESPETTIFHGTGRLGVST